MIALRRLAYTQDELTVLQEIVPKIWSVRGQFILGEFKKDFDSGPAKGEQAYFIELNGRPVGVTGFYRFDEERVGLCWHGILPEYRRNGLGTVTFGMLKKQAMTTYPNCRLIVEIIPEDRKDELESFFVDFLGFEATERTIDHLDRPWLTADTQWRLYEAKLI